MPRLGFQFQAGQLFMPVNEDIFEAQRENIANDAKGSHPAPVKLNAQEQMLVAAIVSGASLTEASRRTGIHPATGKRWLEMDHIKTAIDHYNTEFAQDVLPRVRFTKEDAHHMYMTAYRNSANATEQVKATDALVKLHRINEPERPDDSKDIRSFKQLENMSREQLLKLANLGLETLLPTGDTIEGEYDEADGES